MKVNDAVVLAGASGGLGHAVSEALFKAGGRRVLPGCRGKSYGDRRWTSYRLSRTGWLRPRHALASQDEGMELVSIRESSGLRLRWCAVVWVKENLPLQQHAGHPKQPVGDTA